MRAKLVNEGTWNIPQKGDDEIHNGLKSSLSIL